MWTCRAPGLCAGSRVGASFVFNDSHAAYAQTLLAQVEPVLPRASQPSGTTWRRLTRGRSTVGPKAPTGVGRLDSIRRSREWNGNRKGTATLRASTRRATLAPTSTARLKAARGGRDRSRCIRKAACLARCSTCVECSHGFTDRGRANTLRSPSTIRLKFQIMLGGATYMLLLHPAFPR